MIDAAVELTKLDSTIYKQQPTICLRMLMQLERLSPDQ
jgi:hypothetical protein